MRENLTLDSHHSSLEDRKTTKNSSSSAHLTSKLAVTFLDAIHSRFVQETTWIRYLVLIKPLFSSVSDTEFTFTFNYYRYSSFDREKERIPWGRHACLPSRGVLIKDSGQWGEGDDGTGEMEIEGGEREQNLGVRSGSLSLDCSLPDTLIC